MSTFERIRPRQTPKEPHDELELFTDRYHSIRLFAHALNEDREGEDPAQGKIICFYGDGGNGKTMLLRFLRERCCKKLAKENWNYVRAMEGDEFISNLTRAEGATDIPWVVLDFHNRPAAFGGTSQQATTALGMLRQDLGAYGFRFPLFDFAYIWYLHKAENLSGNMIKSLLPSQDLMSSFIDAVTGSSYASLVNAAIGLFGPKLDVSFTVFTHKWRIDKEQLQEIERLDPRTQLIDLLPKIFATDVNTAMRARGAPERVALFFDTHEAFWQARERENDPYFFRDEWFRVLLKELDRSLGITVVVAGREPPRWSKASKATLAEEELSFSLVGHLSCEDALELVKRAKVVDVAMQKALIEYSTVRSGEVHPLLLKMCIEVLGAAVEHRTPLDPGDFRTRLQASKRIPELLETLLKYVDVNVEYAIRALSACRAFTLDIYLMLGRELTFQATEPNFHVLKSFSFVWEASQQGWVHIHALVRRLLRERTDEVLRRADEVMERYYRQRAEVGEELARAEAIYHANRLDWERGVDEWTKVFNSALKGGRYSLCAALLDVRKDLIVLSAYKRGLISLSEGKYLTGLSRQEEASAEYKQAISAFDEVLHRTPTAVEASYNKGLAVSGLGYSQYWMSQYEEAIKSYEEAITICAELVGDTPDNIFPHNHEAETLVRLGQLQAELTKYGEAENSYKRAVSICDKAIRLIPADITPYFNKGLALSGLAELSYWKSDYHDALERSSKAIDVYDEALALGPDDHAVTIRQGWAYAHIGEVWGELSNFHEAVSSYEKAIAICNEVLRLAPDYFEAHNLKGHACLGMGEMHADVSQCQQGIENYKDALAAYQEILIGGSRSVDALNGTGYALTGIGELHAKLARYKEARESYRQAIEVYDEALRFAPDDVVVANNKAYCLTTVGDCLAKLDEKEKAIDSYRQAIMIYGDLLRRAPEDAVARDNKGVALSRLGYSQYCMSDYNDALESYLQAISAHNEALRHASDYASAHNNKSKTLIRVGQLYAALSQRKKAADSYRKAIASCDKSLNLAPDCVDSYNNKGLALASLGDLQVASCQHKRAEDNYFKSISFYDKAVSRAPDDVDAHNNKGFALLRLGELQAALSQRDSALSSLRAAQKELTRCLEIGANTKDVVALQNEVQKAFLTLFPNPNEPSSNE